MTASGHTDSGQCLTSVSTIRSAPQSRPCIPGSPGLRRLRARAARAPVPTLIVELRLRNRCIAAGHGASLQQRARPRKLHYNVTGEVRPQSGRPHQSCQWRVRRRPGHRTRPPPTPAARESIALCRARPPRPAKTMVSGRPAAGPWRALARPPRAAAAADGPAAGPAGLPESLVFVGRPTLAHSCPPRIAPFRGPAHSGPLWPTLGPLPKLPVLLGRAGRA